MPRTKSDLPFDWWVPRSGASRAEQAQTRERMYLRELHDRARLLAQLNYGAEEVKARLRNRVAWDFELHQRPSFAAQIDGIVDDVFRRGPGGDEPIP
jgi:hypothetical protein